MSCVWAHPLRSRCPSVGCCLNHSTRHTLVKALHLMLESHIRGATRAHRSNFACFFFRLWSKTTYWRRVPPHLKLNFFSLRLRWKIFIHIAHEPQKEESKFWSIFGLESHFGECQDVYLSSMIVFFPMLRFIFTWKWDKRVFRIKLGTRLISEWHQITESTQLLEFFFVYLFPFTNWYETFTSLDIFYLFYYILHWLRKKAVEQVVGNDCCLLLHDFWISFFICD